MTELPRKLPIKLHYRFDAFLMYLIQDVTKRPTADILNFFHELSTQVAIVGQDKKKGGGGIKKKIDDYFPGTSIPFHMELEGGPRQDYNYKTRQMSAAYEFVCTSNIGFPDRSTYIDAEKLNDMAVMIMERELLGAELPDMDPFVRPETYSPRMYKDLMDNFAGRPAAERTRKKKVNE